MKCFTVFAVVMALSLACLAGVVQADLVTNGDFETVPASTGWTAVGNVEFWNETWGNPGGDAYMKYEGAISQSFGTVSAGTYSVSYDAGDASASNIKVALEYLDGSTWTTLASDSHDITVGSGNWETFSFDHIVLPGDPSIDKSIGIRASLADVSNGNWVGVDNFSVSYSTVTPEPSSIVILATALLGLLAYAWRKRR